MLNLTKPPPTTNETNTSLIRQATLQQRDLILVLVIIINSLSFITNIAVIVAIACVEKLRRSFSSVFIFGLCILDVVASGTVVPKSIAIMVSGSWIWNTKLCIANGFFNSFLLFAIIFTICAIELEKYYCIKHPMHHAGHMTILTALVAVGIAWVIALVLAAVPLVFWNGYEVRPKSLQCTYLWARIPPSVTFGVFIAFVCLVLPSVLMLHINCTMYRIAKKAMRQIAPVSGFDENSAAKTQVRLSIIVTGTNREPSITGSPDLTTSLTATSTFSRNNSGFVTEGRLNKDRQSIKSESQFRLHAHAISKLQKMQNVPSRADSMPSLRTKPRRRTYARPDTNYKALKSLVVPFVYFILVWGSFFLLHLTWSLGTFIPSVDIFETMCTMLVYISYSLNPFVYGLLNKTFRGECIAFLQKKMCASRHEPVPSRTSCENFLQFLDRTSFARQGQSSDQDTRNGMEQLGVARTSVIVCRETLTEVGH